MFASAQQHLWQNKTWPTTGPLGAWCAEMRKKFKEGTLEEGKFQELNNARFFFAKLKRASGKKASGQKRHAVETSVVDGVPIRASAHSMPPAQKVRKSAGFLGELKDVKEQLLQTQRKCEELKKEHEEEKADLLGQISAQKQVTITLEENIKEMQEVIHLVVTRMDCADEKAEQSKAKVHGRIESLEVKNEKSSKECSAAIKRLDALETKAERNYQKLKTALDDHGDLIFELREQMEGNKTELENLNLSVNNLADQVREHKAGFDELSGAVHAEPATLESSAETQSAATGGESPQSAESPPAQTTNGKEQCDYCGVICKSSKGLKKHQFSSNGRRNATCIEWEAIRFEVEGKPVDVVRAEQKEKARETACGKLPTEKQLKRLNKAEDDGAFPEFGTFSPGDKVWAKWGVRGDFDEWYAATILGVSRHKDPKKRHYKIRWADDAPKRTNPYRESVLPRDIENYEWPSA